MYILLLILCSTQLAWSMEEKEALITYEKPPEEHINIVFFSKDTICKKIKKKYCSTYERVLKELRLLSSNLNNDDTIMLNDHKLFKGLEDLLEQQKFLAKNEQQTDIEKLLSKKLKKYSIEKLGSMLKLSEYFELFPLSPIILKGIVEHLKKHGNKNKFFQKDQKLLGLERVSNPQSKLDKVYDTTKQNCIIKIIHGLLTGHEFHPAFASSYQEFKKNHTDVITTIGWSPDGEYLVSGGLDGKIIIWDITSKNPIEIKRDGPLKSLDIHKKGYIAAGMLARNGKVEILDSKDSSLLKTLETESGIGCVRWSNNFLAVGCNNGDVYIYNVPSFELYKKISIKNMTSVSSISWHPTEDKLACTAGEVLYDINIKTGRCSTHSIKREKIQPKSCIQKGCVTCEFNKDGKLLFGGDGLGIDDKEIPFTGLNTSNLGLKSVSWHPDGTYYITTDGQKLTFLINKLIYEKSGEYDQVSWHPNGTKIALSGRQQLTLLETSWSKIVPNITTIPMALLMRHLLEKYIKNNGSPITTPSSTYNDILQDQQSRTSEWQPVYSVIKTLYQPDSAQS